MLKSLFLEETWTSALATCWFSQIWKKRFCLLVVAFHRLSFRGHLFPDIFWLVPVCIELRPLNGLLGIIAQLSRLLIDASQGTIHFIGRWEFLPLPIRSKEKLSQKHDNCCGLTWRKERYCEGWFVLALPLLQQWLRKRWWATTCNRDARWLHVIVRAQG